MEEEHRERRAEEQEEEEEEEETIDGQEETERGEKDRTLQTPSRREEEEEEEEMDMMKAGAKHKAQRDLIGGHTPISTSSPLLSTGRGGEEDDEVRVAIVTIEDESCPSEPFGTAHLETANQISRIENHKREAEGVEEEEEEEKEEEKEEEEEEMEEANSDGGEEEEEERAELTSPSLHVQSQVGTFYFLFV